MSYREDIGKKDQGRAFMAGGFTSLAPDEDGPAIMVVATLAAGENGGTYNTQSK
jgi:hypothetical protein